MELNSSKAQKTRKTFSKVPSITVRIRSASTVKSFFLLPGTAHNKNPRAAHTTYLHVHTYRVCSRDTREPRPFASSSLVKMLTRSSVLLRLLFSLFFYISIVYHILGITDCIFRVERAQCNASIGRCVFTDKVAELRRRLCLYVVVDVARIHWIVTKQNGKLSTSSYMYMLCVCTIKGMSVKTIRKGY